MAPVVDEYIYTFGGLTIDREVPKYYERNQTKYHFVYYKSCNNLLDKVTLIKTLFHNWHIPSDLSNKPCRMFLVSSIRAILSFHIMPCAVTTRNNHEPSH